MAINLDELRPSTARRIANIMCALFSILALCSVAFGVRPWLNQSSAADGISVFGKITGSVLSCVVAAVVFYVGLRFGRYSRKLRGQHRAGA